MDMVGWVPNHNEGLGMASASSRRQEEITIDNVKVTLEEPLEEKIYVRLTIPKTEQGDKIHRVLQSLFSQRFINTIHSVQDGANFILEFHSGEAGVMNLRDMQGPSAKVFGSFDAMRDICAELAKNPKELHRMATQLSAEARMRSSRRNAADLSRAEVNIEPIVRITLQKLVSMGALARSLAPEEVALLCEEVARKSLSPATQAKS
jgi:hypothetical protein